MPHRPPGAESYTRTQTMSASPVPTIQRLCWSPWRLARSTPASCRPEKRQIGDEPGCRDSSVKSEPAPVAPRLCAALPERLLKRNKIHVGVREYDPKRAHSTCCHPHVRWPAVAVLYQTG